MSQGQLWRIRCWILVVCLIFLMGKQAAAIPISIVNPGFEDDVYTPGDPAWNPGVGEGPYKYGIIGWQGEGGGVLVPSSQQYPEGIPEGTNVAWIHPEDQTHPEGGVISQQLNDTLQANTIYTLTVYVGNRADYEYNGYRVELWAGGTLLAYDENSITDTKPDPLDGKFLLSTVQYISPGMVSPDQYLEIRLNEFLSQANFDLVQLDATPVPLPSTLLLLGSGLLRLAAYRRRESVSNT